MSDKRDSAPFVNPIPHYLPPDQRRQPSNAVQQPFCMEIRLMVGFVIFVWTAFFLCLAESALWSAVSDFRDDSDLYPQCERSWYDRDDRPALGCISPGAAR